MSGLTGAPVEFEFGRRWFVVGWESSTRRAMKVWHLQSGRRRGTHEARDGVELSRSKWAGDWRTFTKLMILHILK